MNPPIHVEDLQLDGLVQENVDKVLVVDFHATVQAVPTHRPQYRAWPSAPPMWYS